ncbi:sigmaA [Reptilian orthoreovirus]|uniref:SigmaA n=1 Tax=chelonian orthoreovirus TaxID=3071237 RepID=A0A1D7PVH7_9REOV|nr:sigmaA [Reptilian orthoreovirus]AOM63692.1 sigmaA [chelonian orthoreovirus]
MARAAYPYFTTAWADATVPLTRQQLFNLLSSSNNVWQMQNLTSFLPIVQTSAFTELIPVPGATWYQTSLIYSAFINIAVGPAGNWKDHYFRDTVWTGPDLTSVVRRPNNPAYVEQDPPSAQFLDMLQNLTWANMRFPMYRLYAQTYRLSLLNASLHGPIIWVETGLNFITPSDAVWLSSMIGRDFREIAFRQVQSTVNMPFAIDDHYDTELRALIAIFMLSYIGAVNQTNTIRGYYFATKERGTGLETWTLEYNLIGNRVNILAAHQHYFGIQSPDWNADPAILSAAALSSIRQSIRAVRPIRDASLIPQARGHQDFSDPNGAPVNFFTLSYASEYCLRAWRAANLITQNQLAAMLQKSQDSFAGLEVKINDILAQDNARMQANPPTGRRIKPFNARDWLVGQSNASLVTLTGMLQ